MLVYAKNPMGYLSLGPHRIYGKYFNYGRFGPANIPKKLYRANKDILVEAEYTTEWLEEKFGGKFPELQFKLSEFWRVDTETLVELARLVGVDYINRRGKPTDLELRALRRAILIKITE